MAKATHTARVRKDVWKVPGLEKRCQQLIQEGALLRNNGLNDIVQTIMTEHADKLTDGLRLTKKALAARMNHLVWTSQVLGEVRKHIRHRADMAQIRARYYAYIPERMFDRKVKFLTGLNKSRETARFVAGVGRLITEDLPPGAETFEFPLNDYAHPVVLPSGDGSVLIPNAANIGVLYNPVIEENPLRRALSDAQKRGAKAVILTNFIHLDTKKTAGTMHIYRAQVSGIKIKLEHLPESYREKAARILREQSPDEVVFQNIAAKFLGVMEALEKISHRPNDKGPEFTGPVYVCLGVKEEELINEAANAELRYIRIVTQNRLMTELKVVNRLLAYHERQLERENLKDDQYALHQASVEMYSERQKDLSEELAMTILTNVSDEDRNRQRKKIRALLVYKVQQVIPNCTVVSQGSAYFRVDDKTIKIHIPGHDRVTDRLLADVGEGYGFEVFTDKLADITVVCHPYPVQHRMVGREDSSDGQPVTKYIHVAPACQDDVYLREQLRDATKMVHPLHKIVFDPAGKPGVLMVTFANGTVQADALAIAKMDRTVTLRDTTNFAFPYPETKYINMFCNTDNHFGSRSKRYIWDPKERVHLGATEAAVEMFRRCGLVGQNIPIHMVMEMDDETNGDMFFSPRYQPHPLEVSALMLSRWLREMSADLTRAAEKGDMTGVVQLTEEMEKVTSDQLLLRGDDWPHTQMVQAYERHVEALMDFNIAVLNRFERSKLRLRGLSDINHVRADTRDIGVINYPDGNHRAGTLKKADGEGGHIVRHAQALAAAHPHWAKRTADLKRLIRAPRHGNVTFGAGTVKVDGGFEWGIRLLNAPPRLDSWADLVNAMIRNDIARGDDTYGLLKYVTVTLLGDKHFYAMAETARILYAMFAAGTHTDLYGSTGGFPPNNTGVGFLSLPVDGPDAGPVLMRTLAHDVLRDWFAKPREFNWKKFLPKAV